MFKRVQYWAWGKGAASLRSGTSCSVRPMLTKKLRLSAEQLRRRVEPVLSIGNVEQGTANRYEMTALHQPPFTRTPYHGMTRALFDLSRVLRPLFMSVAMSAAASSCFSCNYCGPAGPQVQEVSKLQTPIRGVSLF